MCRRAKNVCARIGKDRSGISITELALCLPPFLFLGMYGIEVMNLASANLQVSQLALSVADNASRLGQTDNSSVTPTVTETDVDSVMFGAMKQGEGIDFEQNGRIILSSLEYDNYTRRQYIHWQRCRGDLDRESAYGNDTDKSGLTGDRLYGMGVGTNKITANPGSAVMYAEVFYKYEGIFGDMFVKNRDIVQEAAFLIRDDRNLSPGVSGTNVNNLCS
ncbi:pilus assembly protein TadE [Croceicoccus estronivorus]|nr:pilus assembly protein TadE [Croceicoccus estronivorus]